jgi:hypothetical protein
MKTPPPVKILLWAVISSPLVATIAQAQEAEKCSLQQISDALNQLPCEVDGAFVSPESLVTNISALCDYTVTADECHICFAKGGHKTLPAFKTLVKLRMLPPTSFPEFMAKLIEAEAITCAAKPAQIPSWDDDNGDTPPEDAPPAGEAPNLDKGKNRQGGINRGGQQSGSSRNRGRAANKNRGSSSNKR